MDPSVQHSQDELDLFRGSIGKFLDREASSDALERWKKAKVVDRDLWHRAGEFGLLGVTVPTEYGGMGGDFRHERIILEECAKRGLEGWGIPVHNTIVAPYIVEFGTAEQKSRWLPKVVSGEIVLGIAMTEPGAGSDLQGIRTRARQEGDEWIIDGQKTFISNGQTADLVLVCCRTSDARSKGLSILCVERGMPGFTRGRNLDKMGREAQDTSELFFESVQVPVANVLGGQVGQGFAQLMKMLPQERLCIATMGLGILERALELTIDYAKQRRAFGKTLLEFQNTQFTLAEIKTQARVARVFIDHCTAALLTGSLDAVTASMAKYWVCETEVAAVSRCLQIFGGYGYMNEYPIAGLYKDARIDTIHGGTSEIMKMLIARTL